MGEGYNKLDQEHTRTTQAKLKHTDQNVHNPSTKLIAKGGRHGKGKETPILGEAYRKVDQGHT